MSATNPCQEILSHLPHRYPFLLVDRVLEIKVNESIRALKNVSMNEQYFCGHFPGSPVMPGVLIIEALAQTAGILAHASRGSDPLATIYYLAGVDNARFKRIVLPGDQLLLEVQVDKAKRDIWKFNAKALVENELVCSCDLLCAKKENKS